MQIVPIPGLELGTLMAVSPYGKTYRGFYRDQPVAVKVCFLCQESLPVQSVYARCCTKDLPGPHLHGCRLHMPCLKHPGLAPQM